MSVRIPVWTTPFDPSARVSIGPGETGGADRMIPIGPVVSRLPREGDSADHCQVIWMPFVRLNGLGVQNAAALRYDVW
jgi:hypothetical protein